MLHICGSVVESPSEARVPRRAHVRLRGGGRRAGVSHCGMPFSMKEDRKKIKTDDTLSPARDGTRHATLKGKVNAVYL